MRHFRKKLVAGSLLAGVALPGAVHAQEDQGPAPISAEDNSDGGAIVVTARKRDERLIDVPETITAFSGAALERAGIQNIDDLGRALPNVILNRRGDNEPNVVIRGIGAFGNVQGIGFYIDDVQNFTDQASRLVDLERVEVLKGPQGTLYGGSSIGGAVKYVTKKPSGQFEGGASVEAGERGTINVNGSVNVPLSDAFFVRISGYTDNSDGYSRNPITGVNNDKSSEYGFRAALRFNPSDSTDIVASFRYSRLNNGGNDYYVTDGVDDYRYVNPLNVNIFNKRKIFGGIVQVNQNLGAIDLTSITSYTRRENRIQWDLDYGPGDGVLATQHDPVVTKVFTQELRLASDNDGAFNWIAGLYAARTRDRLLVINADVTLGPDATDDGTTLFLEDFNNSTSLDQNYAGFLNLTYEIGDLEVSAGARLNYNKFSATNFNLKQSGAYKDTTVLPKLSLSYKAAPGAMIYATYSRGYEPGKLNLIADELAPYKPETTSNFELGVKGQVAALTYEIAGFYIINNDRQFETQVIVGGVPLDLTTNIGKSRSYGIEAAATIRATPELTLNFGGGYLNSKYKRAIFQLQDYAGSRVPYAPEFSANGSIDFSKPINDSLKFSARADVMYTGSFFWDIPNRGRQDAYALVGLRAALGSVDDRWEFAVRAQNLFNQGYHTELLYNFTGDPSVDPTVLNATCNSCHLARVGAPRQVMGTLSYRF